MYGDGQLVSTGATGDDNDAKAAAVVTELQKEDYGYRFEGPFTGGKGYYNVWVNDLKKTNGSYENLAPVFRNDWYDLTINDIQLPGDPQPDIDPEEPIHPDTYMAVTLTVRLWNKVTHNVDLQ